MLKHPALVSLMRCACLCFGLFGTTLPVVADEAAAREIVERRCVACHGPTGQATSPEFPRLAGQNTEYLTKQMFNFQTRVRRSAVMEEQMAELSGNDIEALARYFSQQRLVPDNVTDRQLLAQGRKVFFEGNPQQGVSACVSCHGPAARGAQMLPRLAGQHAAYLERQLRAFIDRSRTNDQASMHMVARSLTSDEIRAVAYFLSGLE